MKLSTFMLDNIEPILYEWEDYAKTIFPLSQKTNASDLREYAKKILVAIATDLECRDSKSMDMLLKAPSEAHGLSRLRQGFTINEIVLEYRALRKSVINLFGERSKLIDSKVLSDLIQFNELIDSSLSDAIHAYSLKEEQQTYLFDTMLSAYPDLSYILDLDGTFLFVNAAMANLCRLSAQAMIGGRNYNAAMPTSAEIQDYTQSILATGKSYQGEINIVKTAVQSAKYYEFVLAPVQDKNKKIIAIAGTSRDITKQKLAEAQVWYYANYDDVTGLVNRRRFRDRLNEYIRHTKRTGESFALFFMDLDYFKTVNDLIGHDGGDVFLKKIAKRILASVRETDIVARMGGDEFTFILLGKEIVAEAPVIADKLLVQIRKPIQINKQMIHITASIGIAFCPQDGCDVNELLIHADKAMYFAKKTGRDKYCKFKD